MLIWNQISPTSQHFHTLTSAIFFFYYFRDICDFKIFNFDCTQKVCLAWTFNPFIGTDTTAKLSAPRVPRIPPFLLRFPRSHMELPCFLIAEISTLYGKNVCSAWQHAKDNLADSSTGFSARREWLYGRLFSNSFLQDFMVASLPFAFNSVGRTK